MPDNRVPDNLNGWLRRIRPRAGADADDWATSAEADDLLDRIHARIDAPPAVGGRRLRWLTTGHRSIRLWLPAGAVAAAAAVVLALVTPSGPASPPADGSRAVAGGQPSAGVATGGAAVVPMPAARPAAQLLTDYQSCPDLLAGLRSHAAEQVTSYGLPGVYGGYVGVALPAAASAAGPAVGTAGSAVGATSSTNDQVAGVDEPDVMKTDGNRVVTVTDGTLRVVDAETHKVTGSLDLTLYSGWQGAQLLVDGDHAIVLLGAGGDYAMAQGTYAIALFVDLSGSAPRVTGSLRADGGYLAARLVGDTVRLVSVSNPTINFPQQAKPSKAANQKVVRTAPLSAWQPGYTLSDGATTTHHTVPCTSISHPADYTGLSMVTVYTLTMGRPDADPQPISVVADGDTVYATATSLYVASNPAWWFAGGPVPSVDRASTRDTEIHRFDIAGTGRPSYLGSGRVPGRLLSQYSLSDYDGYLRVATTTDSTPGSSSSMASAVYVLDDATLKSVGHVGGLGAGERIYAVRFTGPLGYVVTFRQVDPLYVLDLSDPRAPKVAGELELSGYSTYLHDGGDGRLIGVGADVGTDNEPDGVQVSLYDVTDPSTPKRVANVVSKAPGAGEGQLDPHAFLYWQPTGLVVVPQQSWVPSASGAALVLRVSGMKLTEVGTVRNPVGTAVPDDGQGIVRSMLVDGQLWTLSGSGLQVLDPATLHRDAWIAFS